MPADSNSPPELSQGAAGCVPGMTRWERFVLCLWPAWLALLAIPLLAVTAFGLIKINIAFWPNSHWYFHHRDRLKMVMETVLAVLAYTAVILGALLVYPALFFRRMLRRKKETGSVFPQGEELAAHRRKRKTPSLWTKTWVVGVFALIAAGWTHVMIRNAPHHHFVLAWSFPALMWVVAIMVAIDAFFPRRERLWTGVIFAAAFGALTVFYVIAQRHISERRTDLWFFPILWGSIAIAAAIAVIGDWRQKRGRASGANRAP